MSEVLVPYDSSTQDPTKPSMRGWIHLLSAIIAIPAGWFLVKAAVPGHLTAGALTYAASLVLLLGISGTYHTPTWSERPLVTLRLLDHSMIFILIGGSYTPFLLAMNDDDFTFALPLIWCIAILGILRTLFLPNINRFLKSMIYVAVGWMAVPLMKPWSQSFGFDVIALLLIGGVAYTLGALVYARRWPDPWPQTFGYHEIFHAGVVFGSVCHFIAVWRVVT